MSGCNDLRNVDDGDAEGFSRRNFIIFLIAVAVMAVILWAPVPGPIDSPDGPLALSAKGKATIAVLAFAVLLWATEAIPFPVTGLLAMVFVVMAKAASLKDLTVWGFGNTITLFVLGVMIFSTAISETTLLKRVATVVLYYMGDRASAIILAFLIVGALISPWISDMAVAAMLLPVALSILRDANAMPRKSNFGRALLISCAWGPLIGGVATPAGCGPNPLTIGFLKDLAGIDLSFRQWMVIGFPATILMIPFAWFILIKVFPLEPVKLKMSKEDFHGRMAALGRLKANEIAALSVFSLMVILWVFPDVIKGLTHNWIDYLDIYFVALACPCLFFVPGIKVINWKQAEHSMSWGGLVLIAGGLALGNAIHATGAAKWLAFVAFSKLGVLHPVLMVFAVVLGVCLMKVMFSSNTVTGAIMVPLLIALAKGLKLDPGLVAIPAGITASLSFILVTSTPTNVIPYAAGYFSIKDMAKAGLIMSVAASACVTASICIIGPLTGIVKW